jgi:hypothetical protein
MPATKTQLTGGVFQDSEGNVLNAGYLLLKLNQDNSVPGVGNICSGIEVKIILNSSGSVDTITPQYVWATDVMTVANAFYTIVGYTAAGQRAWGPNNQQVTSAGVGGGTFDCGLWVPNQVYSWTPSGQPTVSLRTNGTPNGSQVILNLKQGTGINVADDGVGGITVTNTAPAGATPSFMIGPGILNPIVVPVTSLAAIGNGTANAVWVNKFYLTSGITGLTHLDGNFGCNLGPGSNFSIGFYDTSGNQLWTSGTLHVVNTGFVSSSYTVPALTLPAGTYYYVWTCDDTGNTTARGCNNLSLMSFVSSTSDGNVINQGSITLGLAANVSTVGAVLPGTLGALSVPTVAIYTPLVMFR